MNHNHPKVNPPRTAVDLSLEAVAVALLLALVGYVAANYASLPERIPMHFNASGQPDGWGHRSAIWLIPGISLALNVLLLVVSFIRPWYWNIPVRVTTENAAAVYRVTRRLLSNLRIVMTLMFSGITIGIVRIGHQHATSLPPWLLWASLGSIAITLLLYFVRVRSVSRSSLTVVSP